MSLPGYKAHSQVPRHWPVLAGALLIELVSGLSYAFSLYSPVLKQQLQLSQWQVNLIGTAANLGGNFGVPAGLMYVAKGPKLTLSVAGLMGSSAWIALWAILRFALDVPFYWLVVIGFLSGHSMAWADIAVIPTVTAHFPKQRGVAVGLVKAFLGLSGGIASLQYETFFLHAGGSAGVVSFLGFLGVEFGVVVAVGTLFMHLPEPSAEADSTEPFVVVGTRTIRWGYWILSVLASMLLLCTVTKGGSERTQVFLRGSSFAILPAFLLIVGMGFPDEKLGATRVPALQRLSLSLLPAPQQPCSYSLREAVCQLNFWLQFVTSMLGGGSGLMLINNMGQINTSLGGLGSGSSVLVSLLSIFGCAGRLLQGPAADWIFRVFGLGRPVVSVLVLSGMAMAFALLLTGTWASVYAACVLIGIGFGAQNAIAATIASEVFGLANMASIYGTLAVAQGLGSLLFSTGLAANVYESHKLPGDADCYGLDCYKTTYLICSAACILAALAQVLLARRTRKRYRSIYGPAAVDDDDDSQTECFGSPDAKSLAIGALSPAPSS